MAGGVTLDVLEERLSALQARTGRLPPDEALGLLACEDAFAAAADGNYGVGALMAGPDGAVVERGRNRAFEPRFRSDQHAEMVVLSRFEAGAERPDVTGFTLVTSLEPCLMCTGRILLSGVPTVKFVALDAWGGMATHLDDVTPAWQRLREGRTMTQADVTDELRAFALDCFELNLEELRTRLKNP